MATRITRKNVEAAFGNFVREAANHVWPWDGKPEKFHLALADIPDNGGFYVYVTGRHPETNGEVRESDYDPFGGSWYTTAEMYEILLAAMSILRLRRRAEQPATSQQ